MCNHYRTDPDQIPSWREYAGFDVRQPNAEWAVDLWPKRQGMVLRQEDCVIRSDAMAWGVPTQVKGPAARCSKSV